jgi:hypothetical protein
MTEEEKKIKRLEYQRKWRSANREKLNEQQKIRRATPIYREKHRVKMLEWRKQNPEKAREISRKSYKINGHKENEKRREKYRTDEEYKAKKKALDLEYNKSGKRKLAYHNNPNKSEILKRKWFLIKTNYHEKYLEKFREYRKNVQIHKEREQRKTLSDEYVSLVLKKQLNYQIKTKDIPKELIEAKRNILKLKRITKTKKNEEKSNLRSN